MKDRIKDLFSFSRKEQRGIAILLGLMLCVMAVNYLLPVIIAEKEYDASPFREDIEHFRLALAAADSAERSAQALKTHADNRDKPDLSAFLSDPFHFDPNTLSEEGWNKTGLDPRTIGSILRYREKGGQFRDREDLKKIYTMKDSVYDLLAPFILIRSKESGKDQSIRESRKKYPSDSVHRTYPVTPKVVELNRADSADLVRLPGIGPVFAARIMKYRDLLGGFYEEGQLLEVKGFDREKLDGLRGLINIDTASIGQMDLNLVTFKELLRHPYFEYYLVKAIFEYRDRVKRFDSVGQLKNIELIYEEMYDKIKPYLRAGPLNGE